MPKLRKKKKIRLIRKPRVRIKSKKRIKGSPKRGNRLA